MTELIEAAMGRAHEADTLLEWVEFVKAPEYGWLVTVGTGLDEGWVDIETVSLPPDTALGGGEFWAPTLREALSLAKKASE